MNTVVARHVLVVASESRSMGQLTSLREAANGLRDAFLDPDIGACAPGLPGNEALLYGALPALEIESKIKAAIEYAAARGAALVLAILGHGFIPGIDPTLYFMGWDSKEDVRDGAVDVGKLLVEAADRSGVKGVVGIIDTCTAAAAQPPTAQLATGGRSGQTQLSLLMASSVGQPAYDMNMSRNLAKLLRAGVARAGECLYLTEIAAKLQAAMHEQSVVFSVYHGDPSSEPVWLARNQHVQSGTSSLGGYGTAELVAALEALCPDRELPAAWDVTALYELRRALTQMPVSPAHTRVARVVECLVIAQKTITFLRSFMATQLTTHALQRGLAALRSSGGSPMTAPVDMAQITEVEAVEHVALTFPRAERSCTAQMTRFVLELADDAGVDLDSPELRDWAASIGAIVAFNDIMAVRRQRRTQLRLRLIVSLHYALAGDWPEALGAWLLYDDTVYDHEDFACTPDQPGAEKALTSAVDWAEDHATNLGVILRRIEVAVPARVLLRWRPEEVEYGPRLGVNYDVLAHWSRRLDPQPDMRRINRNAARRLAEIATCTDGSHLHWLARRQISETARLCKELRAGRYPGAIGLIDNPGENEELFELLLQFAPILLWPQDVRLTSELRQLVASCWDLLPGELLIAYRARWRADDGALMANLRAVWDDQDWLEFCRGLLIPPSVRSRSI
jgi:hypothetical protein